MQREIVEEDWLGVWQCDAGTLLDCTPGSFV